MGPGERFHNVSSSFNRFRESGKKWSAADIFLTTHYIEEAERLGQRIAFIVKGRIVRIDAVDALMHERDGRHVVQVAVADRAAELCDAITGAFSQLRYNVVADTAIRVESPEPVQVGPLVRLLEDRGAEVSEARKIHPSLEEVFVRITGIEAAAMKQEKEKVKIGTGA